MLFINLSLHVIATSSGHLISATLIHGVSNAGACAIAQCAEPVYHNLEACWKTERHQEQSRTKA